MFSKISKSKSKVRFFTVSNFTWHDLHAFLTSYWLSDLAKNIKRMSKQVTHQENCGFTHHHNRPKIIVKCQFHEKFLHPSIHSRIKLYFSISLFKPFQFWDSGHYGCVQYLHFLSNQSIFSSPEGVPRVQWCSLKIGYWKVWFF